MPTAWDITVRETLDLLDGQFAAVAKGISEGGYALWLGSGISRDKVIGLDGVLVKLLEFLRKKAVANPGSSYETALNTIIGLAQPSCAEKAQIDLVKPTINWTCLPDLLPRLWKQYSAVLATEIDGERADHLLWDGLEFERTFATLDPDVEHLAVAVLALEGVVSDIATPNWDGLIEAAVMQLGHPPEMLKITVTGEDLRGPAKAQATLYKFHGCARRAIAEPDEYRKLIVARDPQIVRWSTTDAFKIVRDQLGAVIQKTRALVIGLSAQDANIKQMFAKAGAHKGWKWDDAPTPIVISAESLGQDQKTLLEAAYGDDYEANRIAIVDAARLRAYAKPLLIALVLEVVTAKLKALLSDTTAPGIDPTARVSLEYGLVHLRNLAAEAGDADRPALIRAITGAISRTRYQLSDGISQPGAVKYYPLDDQPANLMKGKQGLAASGQREAAAALALIGLDVAATAWSVSVGDPHSAQTGALTLASPTSQARVFLASGDDAIGQLIDSSAFRENDTDVVVVCSRKVAERQQRSPGGRYRDGSTGPRYVSLGPMLAEADNLDDLRDAFRKEVAV